MVFGPISRCDGRKDLWLAQSGTPLQREWWEFPLPLPLWWCPMGFSPPKPDTCSAAIGSSNPPMICRHRPHQPSGDPLLLLLWTRGARSPQSLALSPRWMATRGISMKALRNTNSNIPRRRFSMIKKRFNPQLRFGIEWYYNLHVGKQKPSLPSVLKKREFDILSPIQMSTYLCLSSGSGDKSHHPIQNAHAAMITASTHPFATLARLITPISLNFSSLIDPPLPSFLSFWAIPASNFRCNKYIWLQLH